MSASTRGVFLVFLIFSTTTSARCGLLEMSQTLWTKTVAGGLTKLGKLDPLRVPVIKVDQSEGNTSYRLILRNLEIVGLNESTLESIHLARGELKFNLSQPEAGYVSYSDLRDLVSIRYRFHTMAKEPNAPNESLEIVSPSDRVANVRTSSPYQEDRFSRLQQNTRRFGTFEQIRQYDRRPEATAEGFYRGSQKTSSGISSEFETNPKYSSNFGRPIYNRPAYTQQASNFREYPNNFKNGEDAVDCGDARNPQNVGYQKDNRQRQGADGGDYKERISEVETAASEVVETTLRNHGDARTKDGKKERAGYIDIFYADNKANGSTKHFGNAGVDPSESRRVYGIEDVMKDIRKSARFIVHNFTEGEALSKKNDMVKAALEAKRLRDMIRYAKSYQEQQGYFEEGMQLIYHYGGMTAVNDSASEKARFNDTKRAKRAHSEETVNEDDVMHVILRIRVPLLRVRSQYTLAGKVGMEMLRGNGLLVGNFTDLVGDFALELKKVNGELMIVRAAKARLSAGGKRVTLQGMDEKGPVRSILSHGLTAAEAVAAMLADDFATKGLSEKTADAVIYRMYKDLPGN